MSSSKVAIQKAKDLESVIVSVALAASVLGLISFSYLGYIGFLLGLAGIWLGFQKQVGKQSQFWYRLFAFAAVLIALVDLAATYFSR